jgi:peptide/nickel transport system substrate-binding protein
LRPIAVHVLALAYLSGAAWNETGYSNPEFDEKLNAASAVIDTNKRREMMKDIELILQDSGIIIQSFWRTLFRHSQQYVKEMYIHPTLELHLEEVWLDK